MVDLSRYTAWNTCKYFTTTSTISNTNLENTLGEDYYVVGIFHGASDDVTTLEANGNVFYRLTGSTTLTTFPHPISVRMSDINSNYPVLIDHTAGTGGSQRLLVLAVRKRETLSDWTAWNRVKVLSRTANASDLDLRDRLGDRAHIIGCHVTAADDSMQLEGNNVIFYKNTGTAHNTDWFDFPIHTTMQNLSTSFPVTLTYTQGTSGRMNLFYITEP